MSKRSIVLAAAAAALLVTGALPARADNDFWNGFEDQAGRMLAVETWRLGHVVAAHAGARPSIVIGRPVVIDRAVVVRDHDRDRRHHQARRHAAIRHAHRHGRVACRLRHREVGRSHRRAHHGHGYTQHEERAHRRAGHGLDARRDHAADRDGRRGHGDRVVVERYAVID